MKLAIFTTAKDYSIRLIADEAKKSSLNCLIYFYKDIAFKRDRIYNRGKKITLEKKDKIILRDPFQEADSSSKMNKILINYYSQILLDRKCYRKYPQYEDKNFQVNFFKRNKINIPETYLPSFLDKIKSFPVVVKKRISSRGKGNTLIKNREELSSFFDKSEKDSENYIIQKFERPEKDYRILILKNKILGITSRRIKYKPDRTLKVVYLKGQARLPKNIKDQTIVLAQKLGADLVGIDVIKANDKFYFLEANIAPQFKGFSRVSGINVAEKIIKTI